MTSDQIALELCERWRKAQRAPTTLDEIAAFISGVKAALESGNSYAGARQTAIGHIDHMAAWITKQNAVYSFESLGEDMPGIRTAVAPLPQTNKPLKLDDRTTHELMLDRNAAPGNQEAETS